jgi:hypothetical protein
MDVTGYPYWRAFGEIYTKPRMVEFSSSFGKITRNPNITVESHEYEVPHDFVRLSDARGEQADEARRYAKHRGFGRWFWDRYELGVADSVQNRIIIPIDAGYWQGRGIYDWVKPKYLNPKEPGRDVLFNRSALERYDEVAITEGAFSSMAIGENAVALIRKDPTQEQIEMLVGSKPARYIVALEPGAFGTMRKVMDALRRNGKEVIVWKYGIGDPADPNASVEQMDYTFRCMLELGFS